MCYFYKGERVEFSAGTGEKGNEFLVVGGLSQKKKKRPAESAENVGEISVLLY